MITLLFRALMYLVSAGLGLIAADLLLEGFQTVSYTHLTLPTNREV